MSTQTTATRFRLQVHRKTSTPKESKKINVGPWTLLLLARALRYIAGDNNHLTASRQALSEVSRLGFGSIGLALKEMEHQGWLRRQHNFHNPRGPGRACTYHFTDSFPIPASAFTGRVRRFIREIVAWPGRINPSENSVLLVTATLASASREYNRGRALLAQETELSESSISYIMKRLARRKRVALTRRRPRLNIRFAGPSGFIDDVKVAWPEPEYRRVREQVFRYIQAHSGQPLRARLIAAQVGFSIKQVRAALYWLAENGRLLCEPPQEIGTAPNRYFALGDLDRGALLPAPALAPIAAAKSKANGASGPASQKHPNHNFDDKQKELLAENARESTSDQDYGKRNDQDRIPLLRSFLRLQNPPATWVEASYRDDCKNAFRVNRSEYKRWRPGRRRQLG
jgi:hypothetical protein